MEQPIWSEVMKTLQVDDTTYSMMLDLAKKHSLTTKALVDKLVYPLHAQMRQTGRKVL